MYRKGLLQIQKHEGQYFVIRHSVFDILRFRLACIERSRFDDEEKTFEVEIKEYRGGTAE